MLVRAREERAPPTGLPSEITGRDHFAAGPRDQRGQNLDAHAGLEEAHRAVREDGVGAVGVEGVNLPLVGAVEGTGPRARGSIAGGTPKDNPAVESGPGTAF